MKIIYALLFDSVHAYKYSAMYRSPIHYAAYGGNLDAAWLLMKVVCSP